MHTRSSIAESIIARFDEGTFGKAQADFASGKTIQWFVIDNVLPVETAMAIREAFPDPATMRERKTMREHKFVTSQMDKHPRLGEEALFAFHDPRVVDLIARITGMKKLEADPELYAGGLSLMARGHFLNPHLDNSHNNSRNLYRVLNLLYYVSPDWTVENGGNLELWPSGVEADAVVVNSLFNRLVVMTTGPESWHSVSEVRSDSPRCCVSNYYFSPHPVGDRDYFRVTSFRGRPEQPVRDLVLRADSAVRLGIRAVFPKGVSRTTHIYERDGEPDPKDKA